MLNSPAVPPPKLTAFPTTVLLVDDEPVVIDVLSKLLKRKGVPFVTATTLASARAHLKKSPVACVVTDKNLPDGNGLELIREARVEQPHAACILVTGFASTESAVEALRLGATDYIEKPFDIALIGSKVENAINAKRAEFERDHFLAQIRTFEAELHQKTAEVFRAQTEIEMFNAVLELRVEQATADLHQKFAALESGLEKSKGVGEALITHAHSILDFVRTLSFKDGDSMALARAAVTRLRRQLEAHVGLLEKFAAEADEDTNH